jgi:uncharacterized protein (TIGR04255 family)
VRPREQAIEKGAFELPRYRNPPVVEVVLSVAFEPIQGLRIIQLGDLWREHFSYLTEVEEKPPIEMPVERFDVTGGPTLSFKMMPDVPLPRLWFQNDIRTQLVQVQNNFLARNWRKSESSADYPRYPALRELFALDMGRLNEFLGKKRLGEFVPTQCEITYINHVSRSKVDDLLAFVGDLGTSSFPDADAANITTQFLMREGGDPLGRLHLQATTARSKATGEPLVVLTITARGRPMGGGTDGVLAFLDLGRKWARTAFDSVTRPEMQQAWGKENA